MQSLQVTTEQQTLCIKEPFSQSTLCYIRQTFNKKNKKLITSSDTNIAHAGIGISMQTIYRVIVL